MRAAVHVDELLELDAFERAFIDSLDVPHEEVPERFADFLRWVGLDPSPAVEAIADASEGRPVTSIDDATSETLFGCPLAQLPTRPRRDVAVRAGARGGKTTRILAPKAPHAALTVPLRTLAAGERAFAIIVAPRLREARIVLQLVRGIIGSRTELRRMVVNGAPGQLGTADCITLRRPDGLEVDIIVAAAGRGGIATRGKVIVYLGLEEAAFFSTEGQATDQDVYDGAFVRLAPANDNDPCVAQIWMVSTPWVEGEGALEGCFRADWGKHESALCAAGPTRLLNPTWDPTGELEREARRRDPDKAAREIDAIPLVTGSLLFFPPDLLKACTDEKQTSALPFDPRLEYQAAGDLGFRRNSSSLGIAANDNGTLRLAYWEERIPRRNAPLKPSEVCKGFGGKCAEYACWDLLIDFESIESAREHLGEVRAPDPRDKARVRRHVSIDVVEFNPATDLEEAFTRVRTALREGRAKLPNDPRLLAQLRSVRGVPKAGGRTRIDVPTVNGAHGDLAIACVMALSRFESDGDAAQLRRAMANVFGGAKKKDDSEAIRAEMRAMVGR